MKYKLIISLLFALTFLSLVSSADGTDAHGQTSFSSGSVSSAEYSGTIIEALTNFSLLNVTKQSSSGASSVRIVNNATSTVIATSTFTGTLATFSYGVVNITTGNTYRLEFNNGSGTWTHQCISPSPTLPIDNTVTRWSNGYLSSQPSNSWATYFCNAVSLGYRTIVPGQVMTIDLQAPNNTQKLNMAGANFTANYTVQSFNFTNATYYVWNTNGSVFNATTVTITGNYTNRTTLFIDDFALGGSYIWNVRVCAVNNTATVCNFALSNYTFYNTPFSEVAAYYNSSVIETSQQNIRLNISANPVVSSVSGVMWYDGVSYTSNVVAGTGGAYQAINNLDIPLISSNGNKSFWWEFTFTLNDATILKQNSTAYNQTVNRTWLILCNSTYNTEYINFTTHSAENPFPRINATFKTAWSWYSKQGTGTVVRNTSYEDVSETNSSFRFCMAQNDTYIVDSHIEVDASLYAQNSYYLTSAELNASSTHVPIYLLNTSKSTLTVLKVRDGVQNPITDAIIQIQLYDVGTDKYYTVGMAKTSFSGEDIAYLNWYDSLYKFVVIKDGQIIKIANSSKIAETPVIFEILDSVSFSFDKFRDFQYSLTFNNATKNFILTYTKPSGLVDQGCLRVVKRTGTADTQLSLVCETSSSATLYYNIANDGNGTFIATFYATGSWDLIDWISVGQGTGFNEEIYSLLGSRDATAYAFFMSGVIIALFAITPALAIVAAIGAILISSVLGFTILDYTILTGVAIVGVVLIIILKR